jgi:hypothetical protein
MGFEAMRLANLLAFVLLAAGLLHVSGCARAARDTTGFAKTESVTVEAPFEETWQAVKLVLQEHDLDIYTRDKRGLFVAYETKGRRLFVPRRIKYTIELMDVSEYATAIHIEALREVYGVTLLTNPDWHARETKDDTRAATILEAIHAKLAAPATLPEPEADSASVEEAAPVS